MLFLPYSLTVTLGKYRSEQTRNVNHFVACPVDEDIGDVVLEAMAQFVNRDNDGLHGAGVPCIDEEGCRVCNIALVTDTSRHVIEYENEKIY